MMLACATPSASTRPTRVPAQLSAAFEGKPTLVSLWATWCESCATEFDALNRLDDKVRGRGAKVVAISVGEKPEVVDRFVSERGLRYQQLTDPEFVFADALGQRRVPATLVVDRAGKVVFTGGALDADALEAFDAAIARQGDGGSASR